jgi:hypothetical protein
MFVRVNFEVDFDHAHTLVTAHFHGLTEERIQTLAKLVVDAQPDAGEE